MAISVNRYVVKAVANEVNPTGFSQTDSPTIFRKVSDFLGRCAQGAAASNLSLAYAPVYALATVTTTHTGSETSGDTLTVANKAITFETSAAAGASNQVNIAAGSAGTSVGKSTGATTTAGTVAYFYININNDGPQLVGCIGSTGAGIASNLQTAIRALTPFNALNSAAFTGATVSFGSSKYTITSGTKGLTSSVVVTPSVYGNISQQTTGAALLALGVLAGGTETVGTYTTNDGIAALINGQTLAAGFTTSSTSFIGICTASVCGDVLTLTAGLPGTIGNGLALAVSSTGTVMVLTHAWGAATAGTEGTAGVFSMGL